MAQSGIDFGTWSEAFVWNLLNFYPGEEQRYEPGILELAPVVLPEGAYVLGNNHFFGHPVAAKSGDTIVVVYTRMQRHANPTQPNDQYFSLAVTVRSSDGGITWSQPFDLKTLVTNPTAGNRARFGNSIGVCLDGSIVLVTFYGVFRSEDEGQTWTHLSGAFGASQLAINTNIGPRTMEHPQHGLIVLGHRNTGLRNVDNTEMLPAEIWLRYSADKGNTWREVRQELPSWCRPAEPTGVLWQNALIILTRNHGGFDLGNNTWRYAQLYAADGARPLTAELTNIRCSYSGLADSNSGNWHQTGCACPPGSPSTRFFPLKAGWDTTDVSFNPVTKRLEAVCSNRRGGPPGQEHVYDQQTLNLWSIDPNDLVAGHADWRFEGTLLRRVNNDDPSAGPVSDGLHPAGAVIDQAGGVQHIFVYLGYLDSPAGIFRITRTLDTAGLKAWLDSMPQ